MFFRSKPIEVKENNPLVVTPAEKLIQYQKLLTDIKALIDKEATELTDHDVIAHQVNQASNSFFCQAWLIAQTISDQMWPGSSHEIDDKNDRLEMLTLLNPQVSALQDMAKSLGLPEPLLKNGQLVMIFINNTLAKIEKELKDTKQTANLYLKTMQHIYPTIFPQVVEHITLEYLNVPEGLGHQQRKII